MSIVERLLQFIESKGLSKNEFCKKTSLSNGYLDKVTVVGSDKIESIVKAYPELNLNWLILGLGEMIKVQRDMVNESVTEYRTGRVNEPKKLVQGIPYYNVMATAGVIELLGNKHHAIPVDTIMIPNLPKCDGAVPITGDSMYPLLKSGDIVLYRIVQNKHNIIWGEMYLVAIVQDGDEFIFVKYLQKAERPDYVKCVSMNTNHQPVEFPFNSILALGLVKASIRINNGF